jgi:hypothetical protein
MDFVFGEALLDPPIMTTIPTTDGKGLRLQSASKPLSLAWKILWLETDMHPQGKDLYDAALLAERTELSPALLQQVLETYCPQTAKRWTPSRILEWRIDWETFQQEYPSVPGEARDWQERLLRGVERSN